MNRTIRIGTRASRLAMWQAEFVAARLREHHPDLEVEIVPVRTLGDRDRNRALASLGTQGVFTKEIEAALLEGRCDAAVHSLKDLPTNLPPGLSLGAVLERADPRDAWISATGATLEEIPEGAVVGTSSARRRCQLRHWRPDLVVQDLRGNVPTRLRAVGVDPGDGKGAPEARMDATILALAGLERLGLASRVTQVLEPDRFLPAPAQGAIGVEIRAEDAELAERLLALDHGPTRLATAAERAFLEALGGWCHIPVAALATVREGRIRLEGLVGDASGRILREALEGMDPRRLGASLAQRLLEAGGRELLRPALEGMGPARSAVREEEGP
jgi:hydroxymethylbilane synthase